MSDTAYEQEIDAYEQEIEELKRQLAKEEAMFHESYNKLKTQLEQMDDERISWKAEAEARGEALAAKDELLREVMELVKLLIKQSGTKPAGRYIGKGVYKNEPEAIQQLISLEHIKAKLEGSK